MIEYVEPTLFEETNDHDNNTLKVPGQAKRPCGQFLWGWKPWTFGTVFLGLQESLGTVGTISAVPLGTLHEDSSILYTNRALSSRGEWGPPAIRAPRA